jgi:hypothetical protein
MEEKAKAEGAAGRLLREYLSQRRRWSSTLAPSHFNLGAIVTSAWGVRLHPRIYSATSGTYFAFRHDRTLYDKSSILLQPALR